MVFTGDHKGRPYQSNFFAICYKQFKADMDNLKKSLILVGLGLVWLLGGCGEEPTITISGTAGPKPVDSGLVTGGPVEGRAAIGQVAPDFSWTESGAVKSSLTKLKGQPVVVNWWASWCEPCRTEMPLLSEVAQSKAKTERGLIVIGVNLKESEAEVRDYTTRYRITDGLRLVRDEQAALSLAYSVRGLPQTVFIDRDGFIRAIVHGPLTAQTLAENLRLVE